MNNDWPPNIHGPPTLTIHLFTSTSSSSTLTTPLSNQININDAKCTYNPYQHLKKKLVNTEWIRGYSLME